MANTLAGKRVYDNQFMLGHGVVIKHSAVNALVQWDRIPEPMWVRWSELDFEEA